MKLPIWIYCIFITFLAKVLGLLSMLENLVFPPLLYHSSVFHIVIGGPLPKGNQEI